MVSFYEVIRFGRGDWLEFLLKRGQKLRTFLLSDHLEDVLVCVRPIVAFEAAEVDDCCLAVITAKISYCVGHFRIDIFPVAQNYLN